jgi:N6-adenosine-specific RNA methylase IME4
MCRILQDVPITSHLCPGGLVAVWTTNKPSIVELLTSRGGLFEQWGLQLAAEWTWVKMTASGEPLFDVDSSWRKPWETLLIAKKIGSKEPRVPNKMILAVPDVHSRKPGLRAMFQPILGQGYKGLEVFARNLTAGWWSWGDEVLKFQSSRYWEAQLSN